MLRRQTSAIFCITYKRVLENKSQKPYPQASKGVSHIEGTIRHAESPDTTLLSAIALKKESKNAPPMLNIP